MKVYKFGGASVKESSGIINLSEIVSSERGDLVIVVSAFGKTTNALENVLNEWFGRNDRYLKSLETLFDYHSGIAGELFPGQVSIRSEIESSFRTLEDFLKKDDRSSYDCEYDQVVSFGEIWSTIIVARYLETQFKSIEWIDIRGCLKTDTRFRDANVLWDESLELTRAAFNFEKARIYVTQGFIGGTSDNCATTLGREGSDYTAAVLANMLDAESVTVWKDVPGILNADPKWMADAGRLEEISYREAVEMTFSGAKVIHPKTIKPLHNKNIPLYVRSFVDREEAGTVIKADATLKMVLPVFVRKENQMLISMIPRDFSFVMGDNLGRIFHSFMEHGIKVNLVEASAVSLNVCVDDDRERVDSFIGDMAEEFTSVYNEGLELLSVRHYTPESLDRITSHREVLLEQRTRSSVRYVVRTA